jgi:hypothetical protein
VVAGLQVLLVDGRALPMFATIFGRDQAGTTGPGQVAASATGSAGPTVRRRLLS